MSAPQRTTLATIPFELVCKHVLVRVRVNQSRPLPFILDTGDKLAIIDLDRARELGLSFHGEVKGAGAGAAVVTGFLVEGASLTVPGLDGFAQPVPLAFPLRALAGALGSDIDGIFGIDFLQEFVAELDYQAGLLRLHEKSGFQYSGSGESIPIELDSNGHPTVIAEVTPSGGEPLSARFLLDIGSSASLALHGPFVAEHQLLGPTVKTIRAVGGSGVGGQLQARIGRVQELKIGKFRMALPLTFFSQDTAGAFARTDVEGNLGEQILSRFTVILDFDRRRLILEPNRTFDQPFDHPFTGFVLESDGPDHRTFRIADVLEDSPASEAGIQIGDRLRAVDGRPAAEKSLSEHVDMFERPESFDLELERGDATVRVVLRPRQLV